MKTQLLLVISALQVLAAHAQSDWRGPLPLENERPLQSAFLHFPARNPDILERNHTQWNAQLDIANDLLLPDNGPQGQSVREDFETQRLKLSYTRGLGHKLEFGAQTNLTARNGGFLDAPIEAYHRLLGIAGNGRDNPVGRDNIPNNRAIFSFNDANGNMIDKGSAFGIGDTDLWLQRQLSDAKFASSVRVGFKLPTGSGSKIIGSGGFDGGVIFDARYQFAPKVALFASAGGAIFGASDIPNARGSGVQGGLGFEWKRSSRASIVAQIDAATRNVTTGNPFADRTPVIGSIGYKHDVGRNSSYWFSLSENGDYHNYHAPFFGNIAPDANFAFGYQWRR